MYSAYTLNKQCDDVQPWHTSFPIWNQSIVPRWVLTVASWHAYRFLRRQVKCSGIPNSWGFSTVCCHLHKGFSVSTKQTFFWNSLAFFYDPKDVGNQPLVPLSFLNPAWTSGISRFMDCWSLAWRILSITLLVCEMSTNVWYFEHSSAFLFFEIGIKTDLFQPCGTAGFSKFAGILSAALSQHHLLQFEIAQLEFHHLY